MTDKPPRKRGPSPLKKGSVKKKTTSTVAKKNAFQVMKANSGKGNAKGPKPRPPSNQKGKSLPPKTPGTTARAAAMVSPSPPTASPDEAVQTPLPPPDEEEEQGLKDVEMSEAAGATPATHKDDAMEVETGEESKKQNEEEAKKQDGSQNFHRSDGCVLSVERGCTDNDALH